MPTPQELDEIANAILHRPRCEECGERCRTFTDLVEHLQQIHPGDGDPRPHG